MKIAYVCADPGVPVFGTKGCSIHVQEVIRAMRQQGHDVVLFAQRIGGTAPADLADVAVWPLPSLGTSEPAAREREALAANDRMLALLRREGGFDMVYERYSLWSHAGMTYAMTEGIPGLLEVNAPLIEEQATHRILIDRKGAETVASHVFGAASVVVAVSEAVAAYLIESGVPAERVHVVPNGVDAERFTPDVAPSHPAPEGVFTVGFVGTLKPWHGLPDLIEAFAVLRLAVPNARLLLVGDGPEREAIEADLALRGLLDATVFTGAVSPEAVPAAITSMDVAVAPYPRMENCYFSPLKVFEYMASGRAVVGSRNGQLGTILRHDQDGLLYEPGDRIGLTKALLRLHREPGFRRQLGEAAREQILASRTWSATVNRMLRLAMPFQFTLEVAA